jgi:hypothetical protein
MALAERSIDFFLERQRPDGFIQNFAGYQLETGPVLWTMGEHFRYTRDIGWARRVKPKILKACEYLLLWRERNKTEECRKNGCYGMLDGKVADPEDFFHSFMLNAVSYIGLSRAAEILSSIDPSEAEKLSAEVACFKEDIRNAYLQSLAKGPAVPVGDGSWAPMPPPWTEYNGGLCFYADGGKWWTHGTFSARDSMIGPMWLVIGEVLSAEESGAWMMLKSHQMLTRENAALSQPYYCRHDFAHLKRGEVSDLKSKTIRAEIKLETGRLPAKVAIRLPHPEGLKAVTCEGGSYDPATETVIISNFKGKASVTLKF